MTEQLKNEFSKLQNIWQQDESGIEFIYARDLQDLLGYTKWQNFEPVIKKAMISCENGGNAIQNHFTGASNMVNIGSNTTREVNDYKLTRYACYLVAQNGDPRKEQIAFAQNYFATQTRNFELVLQRKADFDRVLERYELKEAEQIFSKELYQRGVDDSGFARIRSKGDEALFNNHPLKKLVFLLSLIIIFY